MDRDADDDVRGHTVDHLTMLGRRLMAVPGYEPAEGMRSIEGWTVLAYSAGECVYFVESRIRGRGRWNPDLEHGATRGVLLEQLRVMFDAPLGLLYDDGTWYVVRAGGEGHVGSGNSIGEALVDGVENWAHRLLCESAGGRCVDALNTEVQP